MNLKKEIRNIVISLGEEVLYICEILLDFLIVICIGESNTEDYDVAL